MSEGFAKISKVSIIMCQRSIFVKLCEKSFYSKIELKGTSHRITQYNKKELEQSKNNKAKVHYFEVLV